MLRSDTGVLKESPSSNRGHNENASMFIIGFSYGPLFWGLFYGPCFLKGI